MALSAGEYTSNRALHNLKSYCEVFIHVNYGSLNGPQALAVTCPGQWRCTMMGLTLELCCFFLVHLALTCTEPLANLSYWTASCPN